MPVPTVRSLEAFRVGGRMHPGLLCWFFLINAIVLFNALVHPPDIGYDAGDHLAYVKALSGGRLVTPHDSSEFFSPPLPYLVPAALVRLTALDTRQAGKAAQLLNVVLSIGTTLFLLRVCDLISPGALPLKLGALGFLGILPVYYKSFAFVRGEPFVAFFAIATAYYALSMFVTRSLALRQTLALGATLGMAGLSRQWGLLLVPAIVIGAGIAVLEATQKRKRLLALLIASLALSALLSSWFYVMLHWRYGSITAFNRAPQERFAFSNQPLSFYLGLGANHLFTDPVRGAFPNQLLPIFYSETWGDYWGYFNVYSKDRRTGRWLNGSERSRALLAGQPPDWLDTNRDLIASLLGRVNLVSLWPSLLALIAFLGGIREIGRGLRQFEADAEAESTRLLSLLIAVSYAGYLWFLIMYPNPGKGDTIKSTYMLHTFPFIAILVGLLLRRINQRWPVLCQVVIGSLAIVFLHNFPVLFTHFIVC